MATQAGRTIASESSTELDEEQRILEKNAGEGKLSASEVQERIDRKKRQWLCCRRPLTNGPALGARARRRALGSRRPVTGVRSGFGSGIDPGGPPHARRRMARFRARSGDPAGRARGPSGAAERRRRAKGSRHEVAGRHVEARPDRPRRRLAVWAAARRSGGRYVTNLPARPGGSWPGLPRWRWWLPVRKGRSRTSPGDRR